MDKNIEIIQTHTSLRNWYEIIAEESAELSQASIKVIRTMFLGNPTNLTPVQALSNFDEEITDLLMCLLAMGKDVDKLLDDAKSNKKWSRWSKRLQSQSNKYK